MLWASIAATETNSLTRSWKRMWVLCRLQALIRPRPLSASRLSRSRKTRSDGTTTSKNSIASCSSKRLPRWWACPVADRPPSGSRHSIFRPEVFIGSANQITNCSALRWAVTPLRYTRTSFDSGASVASCLAPRMTTPSARFSTTRSARSGSSIALALRSICGSPSAWVSTGSCSRAKG
jgi:hypothetical protein